MPGGLKLYEDAVPVSAERHAGLCVDPGAGYAFARNTNAVPLMTVEFAKAAAHYPIVFVQTGGQVVPVALLGLAERQNLFIRPDGQWDDAYIPAFVRRYPFIFAGDPGGERLTVCIDESFAGCNRDGVGDALFDAQAPTPYLQRVLSFLAEYQLQYQATVALTGELRARSLLEPVRADVRLAGGHASSLGGFMTVARARLMQLEGDVAADMLRKGWLEALYLHLFSLERLGDLVTRMERHDD